MAGWRYTAHTRDATRPTLAAERVAAAALALVLLAGLAQWPAALARWQRHVRPAAALWPDLTAQYAALLGAPQAELLRGAEAVLAPAAGVLLVTPGEAARGPEYTLYHRALYFLAPRPVWWAAPAALDGTWEARWWRPAALTPGVIGELAAQVGVGCVLVLDPAGSTALGARLAAWEAGYLAQAMGGAPCGLRPVVTQPTAGATEALARAVLGMVVVVLLGWPVVALARRWGARVHSLEALALAWLLGAGVATLGLWWLGLLGLSLRASVGALSLLAVAAAPLARRGGPARRRADVPAEAAHEAWLRRGLAGLCVLQVAAASITALSRPLAVWDSWAHWAVKARAVFVAGSLQPVLAPSPAYAVTHTDYPLMLPLAQAWLYTFINAPDDRTAALPALLGCAALPVLAYGGLRRAGAGAGLSALAAAAVACVPALPRLAGDGYADVLLAALALAAALHGLAWLRGGAGGHLLLAAGAAGLLPWAKHEGWVLLAAVFAAGLLLAWAQRREAGRAQRLAHGALALLAGALTLAVPGLLRWHLAVGLGNAAFGPVTLAAAAANVDRLSFVARQAAREVLGLGLALAWPLAAVAGLWASVQGSRARLRLSPEAALLLLAPALYAALVSLTYLFSAYQPYQQHVLASLGRLLAQVSALPVLWLALRAAEPQAV